MSDGCVTVAQCVEGLPFGRFLWELLFCGFLAWFLLGALNETAPLAFSFVSLEWHATEHDVTMMSAALALGNFLAIIAGGYCADKHGRLAVIRPALVLTVGAGMVLQTARSFYQALFARFVLGLFSGSLLGVVPPLLAELLPSKHRGFYLTVWCAGWPAGALFSLATGCLLPAINFRQFYTLMIIPAFLLYVCVRVEMVFESPRYLYLAGRRDEGYNILLDMYDKEDLPLPWGEETIAVTSAPPKRLDRGKSASHGTFVTLWLSLAMFCVSAAAQSMKLWMPTMLDAQQADIGSSAASTLQFLHERHRFHFAGGPKATSLLSLAHAPYMMPSASYSVAMVLAQGYIVQLVGIVSAAYLSTHFRRRSMVQWSLLGAGFFTLVCLFTAESGKTLLCGPILGIQLAMQSTGLNFLMVFACEYFPTSRRAKTIAFVSFAAQLGNFTIPVVGGFVVRRFSASGALIFFSSLYVLGWAISHKLPLPMSKEKPLHDVEDMAPTTEDEARNLKRERSDLGPFQAI